MFYKYFRYILFFFFFNICLSAHSQIFKKENEIKEGWSFNFLPVLSYDTDVGYEFGLNSVIYNYGKDSVYPRYLQAFILDFSYSTKGAVRQRLKFDTDNMCKDFRIFADIGFYNEKKYDFYGFNGSASNYIPELSEENSHSYIYSDFYFYSQKTFFSKVSFKKNFYRNLGINATIGYRQLKTNSINRNSLYSFYKNWGVIDSSDDSGRLIYFTGGLVFDTRENSSSPSKGSFTEALFTQYLPVFNQSAFARVSITTRNYIKINGIGVLASRLSYHFVPYGKIPWYELHHLHFSDFNLTGPGGKRTLRGVARNRILAEDVFFLNLEFRVPFFRRMLFGQNFYFSVAPFFDAAMVTGNFKYIDSLIPSDKYYLFSENTERLHMSYGLGGYIIINENFILHSIIGIPIYKDDGDYGFYLGVDYIF